MERTGKKISAAENVKPGKETMMLDKEQLDKVVGAGEVQQDAECPRCGHTGHIYVSFTQKMDNNGKIIGVNSYKKHNFQPYNIETQVYPGFPTDLQAQIMIPLIMANGVSIVNENLFENRMMHVAELCRMGANIEVVNSKATIYGGTKLSGANVMATDLRASASLVIASLVADGITTIDRIYHLDRGYERIDEKLNQCGAKIKRVG